MNLRMSSIVIFAAIVSLPAFAAEVFHAPFDSDFNDATGGRVGVAQGGASLTAPAAPHGGTSSVDLTAGGDGVTYDIMGGDSVSGSYTIGMWVNSTVGSGGPTATFFGTRSGSDQSFDVKFQGGTTIHGDIGTGAAWLDTSADSNIFDYQANQWHHVAYSVTPTGYTLYGNGFALASESFGPATPLLFDATHDIAVGAARVNLSENFSGFVDEVKIHDTALPAAQVAQLAAKSSAAPIPTLFSTGVDNSGAPLPDGTVGDPHYTLTSVPGGTTDIRVSTSAGGFPIGPWLGDNADSAWIGPNNDADMNGPEGIYTYSTTFDLTGFDPDSAFLMGLWAADNAGVDILLNGDSVGAGQLTGGFDVWTPFAIDGAVLPAGTFVDGLNTLDFVMENFPSSNNPTGLRVQVNGFAMSAALIPEPTSVAIWTLLGLAGAGFGWIRWRKRNAASK